MLARSPSTPSWSFSVPWVRLVLFALKLRCPVVLSISLSAVLLLLPFHAPLPPVLFMPAGLVRIFCYGMPCSTRLLATLRSSRVATLAAVLCFLVDLCLSFLYWGPHVLSRVPGRACSLGLPSLGVSHARCPRVGDSGFPIASAVYVLDCWRSLRASLHFTAHLLFFR